MPPEAPLDRAFRSVRRRTWIAHALVALACALAISVALYGAPRSVRLLAASATGAAAFVWRRRDRTDAAAARRIERALPASRNVVITAQELTAYPERASAWMRDRVMADAARATASLKASMVVPLAVPLVLSAATVVLAVTVITGPGGDRFAELRGTVERLANRAGVTRRPSLVVTIEPPAYTGLPSRRLDDPGRLEGIEGSVLRLSVRGVAAGSRVRFGDRELATVRDGEGLRAELQLAENGYIAIDAPEQRLVPVVVVPDRAPSVRIDRPARDLMVPDAARTIAIAASATDDLALNLLELRYTKVSGIGEDFEFVEGTLPVHLVRDDERSWKAAGEISLAALQLEPGDSLVYRAVARDRRAGGQGEASSDTFFVEVAGPGQVPFEGFEMPPDQERYALSQQMVVLKIERLRARERALPTEELQDAAAAIAAEQRAVRAYFVFLMGGHVEDEEVEAEQSSEIQEGRLENTARREISTAVHLMTRVEQGLVAVNTGAALPPARSAVDALQRAFGRNRYILRTPPSRSEIDPGRRLAGTLSDAATWRREVLTPPSDPQQARAQRFIAGVLELAAAARAKQAPDDRVVRALTEQALAIDPASPVWQQAAEDVRSMRLDRALRPALALVTRHSMQSPGDALRRATPLAGAWDAGGRR